MSALIFPFSFTLAAAAAGVQNTVTLSSATGGAVVNYPLQFGRPFVQGAIPNTPTIAGMTAQADIKNRYPDGSVEFAVMSVVVPSIPATGAVVLTILDSAAPGAGAVAGNSAMSQAQMLGAGFDFDCQISATAPGGAAQLASARTMLANGSYKVHHSGPVAMTIELADDTTARKYDIGFDGTHHPLRPRFYVTFWPATNQVSGRAVGENATTTEAGDLAYVLSISTGFAAPAVAYSLDLTNTAPGGKVKQHWAMTNWSRTFWLGGTPSPQVNIDHNLAYLVSTRWLPNYDTTIKPTAALVAGEYALWTGRPHDLYDGQWNGGQWQSAMGATGEWQEIAPHPTWDVLWAYTGDWRMRQMALGMTDLAAAWPANLRETDPTRRLQRSDPTGLNPSTGLGRTVSVTDRRGSEYFTLSDVFTAGTVSDRPVKVGTVSLTGPWVFDGAHQSQPWFVPYVLTGDPWYLNEAYLWAGFSASRYTGAATPYAYGRGPTGAEGGIEDELRGGGWVLRNRAETALMAPDSDPEKAYFTTLTNDALARWEGSFGITGTVFDGNAVKLWGAAKGNSYGANGGPDAGKAPPLGNWESNGSPPTNPPPNAPVKQNETPGIFIPGAAGTITSPWMQSYVLYALGRVKEIGFAAGPLLSHTAQWLITMINNSGVPTLVAMYEMPVEKAGGGFFPTWADVLAAVEPAWLSGVGFVPPAGQTTLSLPAYWAQNLNADGREGWATAAAGFLTGEPGGAAMWTWFLTNVYDVIPDWASNAAGPKWAIIPRTDTNALPAMPTR